MRGTVAKRLRRAIFGDLAYGHWALFRTSSGQIIADDRRRDYQHAKRVATVRHDTLFTGRA